MATIEEQVKQLKQIDIDNTIKSVNKFKEITEDPDVKKILANDNTTIVERLKIIDDGVKDVESHKEGLKSEVVESAMVRIDEYFYRKEREFRHRLEEENEYRKDKKKQ